MGKITSLFAYKVAGVVEATVDSSSLLKSLGLDPDTPAVPNHMIADSDYYAFLEAVVREEQDGHTLPLRAGNAMCCDDYGAFGLAWKSALDLYGSINRAERYSRVLTSVTSYSLQRTGRDAYLQLFRDGERNLGLRLSNEASLASVLSISREVSTQPVVPIAVHFRHAAPDTTTDHEEFFGCPVCFGADRDALLFSHETLSRPNRLGDAGFAHFFDSHLDEELTQIPADSKLVRRVKLLITSSLSEGTPAISDIAGKLAVSGRTLQRRLSVHGHSFQSLIDDSRRELAVRLLQEKTHSLAEVAFLTGFSEQSAFTRAFKRWMGQTPRSYQNSVNRP